MLTLNPSSRLMWARGLKLPIQASIRGVQPSRLAWARGLKQLDPPGGFFIAVAPHVGAWIETPAAVALAPASCRASRGRARRYTQIQLSPERRHTGTDAAIQCHGR